MRAMMSRHDLNKAKWISHNLVYASVGSISSYSLVAGYTGYGDTTTGLFSDNGITPVVADDPVYRWSDQSGNGNHLIQATLASRPAYKTNIINGLPGVLFDGVDDFIETSGLADTTCTIFLAGRWVTATTTRRFLTQSNTNQRDHSIETGALGHYQGTLPSQTIVASGTVNPTSNYLLALRIHPSNSYAQRVNAVDRNSGQLGTGAAVRFALGCSYNLGTPQLFGNIYVYAWLYYPSILSLSDIQANELALNSRFAIY